MVKERAKTTHIKERESRKIYIRNNTPRSLFVSTEIFCVSLSSLLSPQSLRNDERVSAKVFPHH